MLCAAVLRIIRTLIILNKYNSNFQVAYLFFYSDVEDFRSFSISLVSLFRGISGGLDVDSLTESNRIFGPLYFVFFKVCRALLWRQKGVMANFDSLFLLQIYF